MQDIGTHLGTLDSRAPIPPLSKSPRYRLGLLGLMFLVVTFAPLFAGMDRPLSTFQRTLLRQRVERFADRYDPALNTTQRDAIANHAAVSGAQGTVVAARFCSVGFLLIAGGFLIWAMRSRRKAQGNLVHPDFRPSWKTISQRQFVCALALIVSAAAYWEYAALTHKKVDGAGGFVEDGKIELQVTNRTPDQLTAIWDHELVHRFGKGGFNIIGRDAWLAYAYQAVFALERGGTSMLRKSNLNADFTQDTMLHYFYKGVLGDAAFYHDPELAEEFVLRGVEDKFGPARPDADSDDPHVNPAYAANWSSAIGLAGVAWMTAKGDSNTALLYLDDRGHGMTATQTVHDLEQRAPQHVNHDNLGMTALILEARQDILGDAPRTPKN